MKLRSLLSVAKLVMEKAGDGSGLAPVALHLILRLFCKLYRTMHGRPVSVPLYSFVDDPTQAKLSKTLQNANAGPGWVRFAKPRREERRVARRPMLFQQMRLSFFLRTKEPLPPRKRGD